MPWSKASVCETWAKEIHSSKPQKKIEKSCIIMYHCILSFLFLELAIDVNINENTHTHFYLMSAFGPIIGDVDQVLM